MTILKDLMRRRVPQIFGIYLATSWAIIEFLDWFINHFSISPHLSEFVLLILASMIPTVLLIAYFHGRPGKDSWTKTEKIGIPVNLAGVILLLFFVFKGKDLGATTSLVSVEDEEGQIIERMVPKSEFRKKIMLFFPENLSGDTALNWISYGMADMLHTDLFQDYYLEVKSVYHSTSARDRMHAAGYANLTGIPLMLEKEISEDLHLDYFLTGSFTWQDDIYTVNTNLYNSRNGNLISEHSMDGENMMDLVDLISVQLKNDLEVPDYHLEETPDLPVAELTTASLSAFYWYVKGSNEATFRKDWNRTIFYLERAIQEDPSFAMAYYDLYMVYVATNQSEKGTTLFGPLMDHLYKLPEKLQFYVKASYFEFKREYDKQYAVFEMLVNLYPEDIEARLSLIMFLKARNQIDEAIAQYEYILKLDPERHSVLKEVGGLYEQTGRYNDALIYYNRYAEQFPDRAESFRLIGSLIEISGELEEAKTSYERALLLEPDNISDLILLADIEVKTGNFTKASKQYLGALDMCSNTREKALVYEHLANFHELRGEFKKALEYLYLKFAEWEKLSNPLIVTTSKIGTYNQLVRLENEEIALRMLEELGTELDTLLKDFVSIGYIYLYLELEELEKAEQSIGEAEKMISELKLGILNSVILYAQAKIYELQGEYDLAVQNLLEQQELQPANPDISVSLGACYRNIKDYKIAEESLQKALSLHPFLPEAHYELALLYHETGNKDKALLHMKIASSIWEDADPDFEPAILARGKLAEWNY